MKMEKNEFMNAYTSTVPILSHWDHFIKVWTLKCSIGVNELFNLHKQYQLCELWLSYKISQKLFQMIQNIGFHEIWTASISLFHQFMIYTIELISAFSSVSTVSSIVAIFESDFDQLIL